MVCCRREAGPWPSTLSLVGTAAMAGGTRPSPVKPRKVAPWRTDVDTGFVVNQVTNRTLFVWIFLQSKYIKRKIQPLSFGLSSDLQESVSASLCCVTETRTVKETDSTNESVTLINTLPIHVTLHLPLHLTLS